MEVVLAPSNREQNIASDAMAVVMVNTGLTLRSARDLVGQYRCQVFLGHLVAHHRGHQPDPRFERYRQIFSATLKRLEEDQRRSGYPLHHSVEDLIVFIEHAVRHHLSEHH